MTDRSPSWRWATVALVVLAACSSSADAPATVPVTTAGTSPGTSPETTTSTTVRRQDVARVTIDGPVTGGKGSVVLVGGALDLAAVGYTESEYFVTGTASAFQSTVPLDPDGVWTVSPVAPLTYTTRIVVRRPIDPSGASGNVAVEWFNVSAGFDSAPDWTFAHTELIRSGWTWVGVSAQLDGIAGTPDAIVPLAPKLADPERYARLAHPGDSYSYDIFSQVGAAVRTQSALLLGGVEPRTVIAVGESQSAFRLTTYIDAVAPIAGVYDGYLVHSRGAKGAPLSQAPLADIAAPDPTLVRTDLDVPVLNFITETDLVLPGLGYARARQLDTGKVRTWEVAGTAHVDVYGLGIGDTDDGSGAADAALFAAMSSPPTSIYGGIIKCDVPINAGPQTYVLRRAVAALADWVRSGSPPAPTPRLELDELGALVLDQHGNARGGVRTPHVDSPIASLSGTGQTGESFCALFGTTVPLSAPRRAAAYPDHQSFVAGWNSAIDRALSSGALLPIDAARLRTVGAASAIGVGG